MHLEVMADNRLVLSDSQSRGRQQLGLIMTHYDTATTDVPDCSFWITVKTAFCCISDEILATKTGIGQCSAIHLLPKNKFFFHYVSSANKYKDTLDGHIINGWIYGKP